MEYKRVLNVVKGKMCGQPWATVQAKAKEIYNGGNVFEEQLKNLKNPRPPGTGIITFFRPATKAEAALVAAGLVATVSGAAPPVRTPHLSSGCAAAVLVVACAAGGEAGLMETMEEVEYQLCTCQRPRGDLLSASPKPYAEAPFGDGRAGVLEKAVRRAQDKQTGGTGTSDQPWCLRLV